MKKINVLSKQVCNLIAAGEVVDRPYSVVKELVENSLDAGATEISIYIENGGKQLIKVVDNGCGIDKEDMRAAFMPHATSKITTAEDLESIKTLGFRGEALASIAAVSKVELISVTEGNPAYKISCADNKIGDVLPAALEKGTEITVRDIFYNIPVRMKFMKADKKEESDITNFVTRFILGNPTISFKYYVDGALVLQSYGGGLEEAIAQVYGPKTISNCFKISAEKDGIVLSGFISNQNYFKPNKTYQSLFLNGRYITNFTINLAITNAYAKYTMKRQFPMYVLNVDVPPEMVDVNVHPSKADVRFTDTKFIFGVIYSIISSILDGSASAAPYVLNCGRVPEVKSTMEEDKPDEKLAKKLAKMSEMERLIYEERSYYDPRTILEPKKDDDKLFPPPDIPEEEKAEMEKPLEETPHFDPVQDVPLYKYLPESKENILHVTNNVSSGVFARDARVDEAYARYLYEQQMIEFESCKYKGSLFNTYLVYEMKDTVYFIDQHAAHERLIYDELCEKIKSKKMDYQHLLDGYAFDLNPLENEFFERHLDTLKEIGFSIGHFGYTSYRIDGVPFVLSDINLKEFIDDILAHINELKQITLEDILKDKLAMQACKHAVKGGEALSNAEVNQLFKMLKGNIGLKCPHGRPVCVTMTKYDFEKMFKRVV